MTRVLAVVALLAMTWPHLAVMGCAVRPTPAHGSHASAAIPDHEHDGPECQAVTICNAAMIQAVPAPGVTQPATPPLLHRTLSAVTPTTTVPAADPPPPRRLA